MPLTWKNLGKWPPEFGLLGSRRSMKRMFTTLIIFSGVGNHNWVGVWERLGPKMMPLTWKKSWKVAPQIRGFWPENGGENEATVLEFFSADRPH